jgi:ribulose-phosphate 3-epimerase
MLDMVLIMSVNPGFGGQKYIPYSTEKIKALKKMIDKMGLKTDIQVDGGVTVDNCREIKAAGANVLVAGSAIFQSKDIKETIRKLIEY